MGKQRVIGRSQAAVRYAMMTFPPKWERYYRERVSHDKIKARRKKERQLIKRALDGRGTIN